MDASPNPPPTFREALRFWLKLGFISFGGPAGQIAIMHQELVEKRRWISESRFVHALNFCMLLPGPEATQLAIYAGWLLHRIRGGIAAGTLFVLPSALLLWVLSWIYVTYGKLAWVTAIFDGVKPVVVAIVATAVLRLGRRALTNAVHWTLAVLAFVAIYFLKTPFPLIVMTAATAGFVGGRRWPAKFVVTPPAEPARSGPDADAIDQDPETRAGPPPTRTLSFRILVAGLVLWLAPVWLIGHLLGRDHAVFREGVFFSKAALVTFGGAYAVLPYVAQQAVETHSWLGASQMVDGLALAETTPGPLIMVLQFVGFLGGWNHPGALPPLAAATLGAFITTWTTFVPSFLLILLGAPYVERLRGNIRLASALAAVTAAVVGVILNLSVWFGIHVLFPAGATPNWFGLTLGLIVFVGMARWKWAIAPVVLGGAVAGLFRYGLPAG